MWNEGRVARVGGARESGGAGRCITSGIRLPLLPRDAMRIRQAVVADPFKTAVREVDIPDPSPNQVLIQCAWSAISAGTELAVYTCTHQWLKDPNLPDWKFPFRPGYSAAGTVVGSLAIVLGVFLIIAWSTRRLNPGAASRLPKEAVEVLGRAPLA